MHNDAACFDAKTPLASRPSAVGALSSEDLAAVMRYAKALLNGVALPEQVDEEFPEFFRLALGFVHASGSARLRDLREHASLFEGWGEDPLTDDDRVFLVRLLNETKDARQAWRSDASRGTR